jgi:histone H2A
MDLIILLL